MRKIAKKFVSVCLLAAMMISMFAGINVMAAESASAALTDAVFVRSTDPDTKRGGGTLQVNTGTDRRISLLKFDFSDYADSIDRIANMFLTVYYKEAAATSGMKVYIMPDDKEGWDSASYNYTTAHKTDNIVTTSCGTLIYQTTETMVKDTAIITSDLSQAVREHLENNTSNSIVTFKLDGVSDGAYVIYGTSGGNYAPSLKFDVLTDAEYVADAANDISFEDFSSENAAYVTSDLALSDVNVPSDVNISWSSSNISIISNDGTVKTPSVDTSITLTLKAALASDESVYATKDFNVTVLADSSNILYYWDFEGENGLADKIGGATFTTTDTAHAVPVLYTEDSDTVAKITWESTDAAFVANTSSTLGSSSSVFSEGTDDRYIIIDLDFKKDATENYVSFILRDTSNKSLFAYGTAAVAWENLVFVADTKKNDDGTITAYTYRNNNGVYTYVTSVNISLSGVSEFRISTTDKTNSPNLYIDDLKIKTGKEFYAAVNKAADAKAAMNIIDSYSSLGIANIPADYTQLVNSQKLEVASQLLNRGFTSDSAVIDAITSAIPKQTGAVVYYNWDFENGNLYDNFEGIEFMTNHPDFVENSVVYAEDPDDEANGVAKSILSLNAVNERVTFTDALKNNYAKGIFDIVVYDFRMKTIGDGQSMITLESGANRIKTVQSRGSSWVDYRLVVDAESGSLDIYMLMDNEWVLRDSKTGIETFTFGRISHMAVDNATPDVYMDDITVKVYKDILTAIENSTVDNILSVLEEYDSIGIINIPEEYFTLTDDEKAAFASYVKSKTYSSADEIDIDMNLYLSDKELIVMSTSLDSAKKLDTVELLIGKADVSVSGVTFVAASYIDDMLLDVKFTALSGDYATGSVVKASSLGLDMTDATTVKVMLWNTFEKITPMAKSAVVK